MTILAKLVEVGDDRRVRYAEERVKVSRQRVREPWLL